MTDSRPSIRSILNDLETGEESDCAFIVAAGINLYQESLRRISGRTLMGPDDIKPLFEMIQNLLIVKTIDGTFAAKRVTRPSEEEEQTLLQVVETKVGRRV